MAQIRDDYGTGGSGLANNDDNARHPPLRTVLRDIATDIASLQGDAPGWSAPLVVASDETTIDGKAWVLAVHATAGTSAGPKAQISAGVPAAGQVLVTHGATEITLEFAAADAITAARVHLIPYTENVLTEAV
jgi:hypothetical protein